MEPKKLRDAGLKVTLPRVKILEIMDRNREQHLSAEDVYRHLLESDAHIGLATVYRVLTQFEDAGIVRRHNFEGNHAVFELDDGSDHDHLVCMDCGKVEEFVDNVIQTRQQDVAKSKGFSLREHALILYASCTKCSSEEAASERDRQA